MSKYIFPLKHNFVAIVVLLALVEGLSIYINIVAHPTRQPALTAYIAIIFAVVSGLAVWVMEKYKML